MVNYTNGGDSHPTGNGGAYQENSKRSNNGKRADPRWFVRHDGDTKRINRKRFKARGWKSPLERFDDYDSYVLHFKFKKKRRISRISFSLLEYPQRWNIRYYDRHRKKMMPLKINKKSKVSGKIKGTSGHWTSQSFDFRPVRTNIIEFRLKRNWRKGSPGLKPPRRYRLGLKDVSFKITSDGDSDGDVPGIPGYDELISYVHYDSQRAVDKNTVATDVNGDGVLDEVVVPNTDSYWMSSPQGASDSVVAFYCDIRDGTGGSTTFDTIRMLPLQVGPKMTVYYTEDDTTSDFAVSNNQYILQSSPPEFSTNRLKDIGLNMTSDVTGAYTIDATKMGLDLSKSFTIGTEFTLLENSPATADRYLWSIEETGGTDDVSLVFNSSTGIFEVKQGAVTIASSDAISSVYGSDYGVIVSYNLIGSGSFWTFDVSEMTGDISDRAISTSAIDGIIFDYVTSFSPALFRIGNNYAGDKPASANIRSMWVKQDIYREPYALMFFADVEAFLSGEIDSPVEPRSIYYNAVMVGDFTSSLSARVGPNAAIYTNKEWIPIPKDFVLVTNDYELDQTYRAKYLKFEFTGLQPRPYNSASTLPIRGFPQWVRRFFDALFEDDGGYYKSALSGNIFEPSNQITITTPSDQNADIKLAMQNKNDEATFIFHEDLTSFDYLANRDNVADVVSLIREIKKTAHHMKFPIVCRHTYDTIRIPISNKKAYFVGIKDLQIMRSKMVQLGDTSEYFDTFDDDFELSYGNLITPQYNCFFSTGSYTYPTPYDVDESLVTSDTFPSFSKFRTIQVATVDSPWETSMGDSAANLDNLDYVVPVNSTTSLVTSTYQGERGGQVVRIDKVDETLVEYGLSILPLVGPGPTSTYPGNYSVTTGSYPMIEAQTSAAVRMYLPETNSGRYELRLWESDSYDTPTWTLAAKRQLDVPPLQWIEEEISYMPENTAINWYTEIVQIDPGIKEPFIVDMLGVWQRPVTWEVNNTPTDPNTWRPILFALNNPNAYFSFPYDDYGDFNAPIGDEFEPMKFAIRARARRNNVMIGGYQVIPWYEESVVVNRAPIDYNPPWGVSDREDLRAVEHKPWFQGWYHYFPLHASTVFQGYPLIKYDY